MDAKGSSTLTTVLAGGVAIFLLATAIDLSIGNRPFWCTLVPQKNRAWVAYELFKEQPSEGRIARVLIASEQDMLTVVEPDGSRTALFYRISDQIVADLNEANVDVLYAQKRTGVRTWCYQYRLN